MKIIDIHKAIFGFIPTGRDKINDNYDFLNNSYGVEIRIGEGIIDRDVREDLPLQIRVVGLNEHKIEVIEKCEELDKTLKNYCFDDCWICREDAYLNFYTDEEKFNGVLQYAIKNYKE